MVAVVSGSTAHVELSIANAAGLGWKFLAVILILVWYITQKHTAVYLVDFSTFEPPEEWRVSPAQILDLMKMQGYYNEESLTFMNRMLLQSGAILRTKSLLDVVVVMM